MAFFNFENQRNRPITTMKFTSESLVNPLYKPKTLAELKALMAHTGINPAPVALRSGIPEDNEHVDAMDAPPVMIGGDIFENMRESARLLDQMRQAESEFERSKVKPRSDDNPIVSDAPQE